jgi:hypothetical protein
VARLLILRHGPLQSNARARQHSPERRRGVRPRVLEAHYRKLENFESRKRTRSGTNEAHELLRSCHLNRLGSTKVRLGFTEALSHDGRRDLDVNCLWIVDELSKMKQCCKFISFQGASTGESNMPSTVNLYLIGVWFCVGFFTGAGWAVAAWLVGRILGIVHI